jgi:hypothetical protein
MGFCLQTGIGHLDPRATKQKPVAVLHRHGLSIETDSMRGPCESSRWDHWKRSLWWISIQIDAGPCDAGPCCLLHFLALKTKTLPPLGRKGVDHVACPPVMQGSPWLHRAATSRGDSRSPAPPVHRWECTCPGVWQTGTPALDPVHPNQCSGASWRRMDATCGTIEVLLTAWRELSRSYKV